MTAFDMTAYEKAIEPPAVTIDGTTYIGKILSLAQWIPFEAKFKALNGNTDQAGFITLVESYLYMVYPTSKYFWNKNIVKEIIESPALVEIVTHFLACQTAAILPNQKPSTSGSGPGEVVNPSTVAK